MLKKPPKTYIIVIPILPLEDNLFMIFRGVLKQIVGFGCVKGLRGSRRAKRTSEGSRRVGFEGVLGLGGSAVLGFLGFQGSCG